MYIKNNSVELAFDIKYKRIFQNLLIVHFKHFSMEFSAGTKIQNRYEIRSLIDKGGMSEVYLAQDKQLGRLVALKLLKKTDDQIKIKRFRQEARIISTLNHPNILTIYDFGQYKDFHFIISELVNGETLRKFITHRTLTLNEILEVSIQIGNALSTAHRYGIIHRDIKPENIMVSSNDNLVKVLDFGLAKLGEPKNDLIQKPDETTASLFHTKIGMIAGTVYYMSPEQLRGQAIDERTDVWSLGIVVYELLTGQRPFTADNNSDIIAAVLERPAPSITKINSELPGEIETVLAQALAKNKEERFQTVKDFVESLKIIKHSHESNNALYSKNDLEQFKANKTDSVTPLPFLDQKINSVQNPLSTFFSNSKNFWRFLLAAVFTGILSIVGLLYLYKNSAEQFKNKQFRIRRISTAGNISNGVISPDGRFIAFVQNENGKQSLWLRQVDEVAGKELIAPDFANYSGISFSPDGNSIFFTLFANKASGVLKRIPILGGSSQEIIKDVDSSVSFSPDGNRLAFIRTKSREGLNQIVISNTDGSDAQVLSQRKQPLFYSVSSRESLVWSPDGKSIVCPAGQKDSSSEFMNLVEIDVDKGTEKIVTDHKWFRIGKIVWFKDAKELLITATESAANPSQIVKVSPSTGKVEMVTQDLSDYLSLSSTNNSGRLLGITFEKSSNIFTASVENIDQSRQLSGGGFDGFGGLSWTPDERIVFVSTESGNRNIWQINSTGENREQLTFDKSSNNYPAVSKEGRYIVFVSDRTGTPHIWRMNIKDASFKQLTDGTDESFPQITPDSKWVIYSARSEGRWVLWKISIDGGDAVQLAKEQTHWASISPDGKTVACLGRENVPEAPIKLVLLSSEDGKILNRFDLISGVASPDIIPTLRWTPDNQAIAFIATQNGVSNIYLQAVKGGQPKKITNFSSDRIFTFDWSKDGKNVAFARGVLRSDLVLIESL